MRLGDIELWDDAVPDSEWLELGLEVSVILEYLLMEFEAVSNLQTLGCTTLGCEYNTPFLTVCLIEGFEVLLTCGGSLR